MGTDPRKPPEHTVQPTPSEPVTLTPGPPQADGSPRFLEYALKERGFLIFLGLAFLLSGATYNTPGIAMWVGFAFAGYSAVANDSIQTLGTFIASNVDSKWWHMWLFIGGIFLLTVGYSWYHYNGDVTHQRLAAKGFEVAPTSFHFLHIAAPVFLLVLTRLKMPVSTTFLLLSCFATSGKSIIAITTKSLGGYLIAFIAAIVMWTLLLPVMKRAFKNKPHRAWRVGQWVTTGLLWSVWLMQDAANIAVYLPRSLSVVEFGAFGGIMFFGLGLLFFMRGERIQEVVNEKTDVVDVRAATMIDLVYAIILYIFKIHSKVPMSTTWVFIGLLAGRELAYAIRGHKGERKAMFRHGMRLMGKDLAYVTIGFLISLVIAAIINPEVGKALFS